MTHILLEILENVGLICAIIFIVLATSMFSYIVYKLFKEG